MPGIEADLTAAGTVPELHRFPFSSHFHGNLKASQRYAVLDAIDRLIRNPLGITIKMLNVP